MGFLDRLRRKAEPAESACLVTKPDVEREEAATPRPPPSSWHAEDDLRPTLPWGPQVSVVGESYYQESFMRICGPKCDSGYFLDVVAELRPEPDNEYDAAAVGVFVRGLKVGHLSRHDARTLRSTIDDAIATQGVATCYAMVRGGWVRPGGDSGHFGISLRFSDRTWTFAPPAADELRLQPGGAVSVSSEDHYQDDLIDASKGRDLTTTSYPVLVDLVVADANPWVKSSTGQVLEVRVDDHTVGFLTAAMTARYMPVVAPALAAGKRVTAEASLFTGVKRGEDVIEIRLHATPS